LIDSVDAATAEQTSGLNQINAAVSQINDITQQNAALVEESAAAAASLSEQARHLLDVVRQFRSEKDMGPASIATRTARYGTAGAQLPEPGMPACEFGS